MVTSRLCHGGLTLTSVHECRLMHFFAADAGGLWRVSIAHALSARSGELTMSVDELLHIQNVSEWLLPTKCIVRRRLKNEFPTEFPGYLHDNGSYVT
jgi:hypothetical protein